MKLNENQYRLIRFFKCLSNKTRFLVLKVLSGNDEISITELSRILNSSVSTTSKHLSILKNLYLVNCRIKGKYVYYTVQPGDTLWTIAQKYAGVTVKQIKKVNGIQNHKSLLPGTKVKVPIT